MHRLTTSGTPDFTIELSAVERNVATVRHLIGALQSAGSVAERTLESVRLALSEAATNVVVHAYDGDAAGDMAIHGWMSDQQLVICVGDHGRGVEPRLETPGLGLGLPVIAAVADAMEVRGADGGGTEVWMCFELEDAEVAA
jgi:anti-sigma regulatory factor (Ser/Thr protein kinase)